MRVQIETSSLEKLTGDALAVICFETGDAAAAERNPDPEIAAQSGWLVDLRASGEFTGKPYEISTLHRPQRVAAKRLDRKSTRLNSSHSQISYAVFCLK